MSHVGVPGIHAAVERRQSSFEYLSILSFCCPGRGDSSVCAEQNFHYDPEAAYAVLEETPNITLLPYEVCDRHKLTGVSSVWWLVWQDTCSEIHTHTHTLSHHTCTHAHTQAHTPTLLSPSLAPNPTSLMLLGHQMYPMQRKGSLFASRFWTFSSQWSAGKLSQRTQSDQQSLHSTYSQTKDCRTKKLGHRQQEEQ